MAEKVNLIYIYRDTYIFVLYMRYKNRDTHKSMAPLFSAQDFTSEVEIFLEEYS